ncbi:class I SAM-dependent DNA methyltransferase [Pseudalkalibacillus caeni]|uniref:Class I SAM-dependent methyltransferase n=1 Tax=Exobacillus caeni TaxID=2574798 RepID=A0A5R9FAW4_9BACL|nr:class I SAM-dependent methyltransferase [Pseudalkalibacillus caeni]TLS39336.1 class I SAM-dependent methyltransferase [Pseudalkalibacillus caeni]
MSSYHHFAYFYDSLMEDAPYDEWAEYVLSAARKYGVQGKELLDLGIGTGTLALHLYQDGWDVTGIDLSEEMLAVAQEKAQSRGANLKLFNQDMSLFETGKQYDVSVIFCDSLNYLPDEAAVKRTFNRVFDHLKEDGLFLFDVHSCRKINEEFIGNTFGSGDPEVSYIWQSFQGEHDNSVEHELSFFTARQDGAYERYDEVHFQRTFPVEVYKNWLEQSGFTILSISADFSENAPEPDSERIFFAAKK